MHPTMSVYISTVRKLGLTPFRKRHFRKQKLPDEKQSIKIVAKMLCTWISTNSWIVQWDASPQ